MDSKQRKDLNLVVFEKKATALIDEVNKLPPETNNYKKRHYHTRLELMRLDIAEYLENNSEVEHNTREKLAEVDKRLEDAEPQLAFTVERETGVMNAMRYLATWIYTFLVAVPMMLFSVLLYPLHPILRSLGVSVNYLPTDLAMKAYSRLQLFFLGVDFHYDWRPDIDMNESYIALFTHSSNLDPYIVQAGSPISFKWIGKQDLFNIPIFGRVLLAMGNYPIDRQNRESAIKSLDTAAAMVKKLGSSLALSAEGTRSRTGQLMPFKKGPFYTAAKENLTILPVVIYNAYERQPPGQLAATPGSIVVKYLKPIKFPDGTDPHAMINPTRRAILEEMLRAYCAPPVQPATTFQAIKGLCANLCMLFVPYLYYLAFRCLLGLA